jgi:hypothetical protein
MSEKDINDRIRSYLKESPKNLVLSYAKSLIDCVEPYLKKFFGKLGELNDLVMVLDTINNIEGDSKLKVYNIMNKIERLLNFAVDSGDNAAEFSMYIIQSYVEYDKDGDLEVILATDDSLLSVSDYLAQEYELATSHASESEISNTSIMVAYMDFKLYACNLIEKHLANSQIVPSSNWMSISNQYAGVIESLYIE